MHVLVVILTLKRVFPQILGLVFKISIFAKNQPQISVCVGILLGKSGLNLLRFRHKQHLVSMRKRSKFELKYQF